MLDGAVRPVTCSPRPYTVDHENAPLAVLRTTPGEPSTSSAVPRVPSGPGLVARVEPSSERGSEPPVRAWWQDPHATVRVDDTCSSQKSVLPRFALAVVTGFSAGCGGGGSGVSGGGGGGP